MLDVSAPALTAAQINNSIVMSGRLILLVEPAAVIRSEALALGNAALEPICDSGASFCGHGLLASFRPESPISTLLAIARPPLSFAG